MNTSDNKVIAGLLATGLVVGAIAVYPIARASQPVKTVTKSVPKLVMIHNGENINSVLKSFSQPTAETTKPTAKDNYVECVVWSSQANQTQPTVGSWENTLCVKVH